MKLKYILSSMMVVGIMLSCEREDFTNTGVNVLQGIEQDPELSTLNAAINKAGLRSALNGTQYTFLAPTNDAFNASGINVDNMDAGALLEILKYHIIPSRIDSSRFNIEYGIFNGFILPNATTLSSNYLGNLTYQGFQTMNLDVNANVYITQGLEVVNNTNGILRGLGVYFNGAAVTEFDAFEGGDGVVHKINRVLLPPSGNAAEVITANANLSLFNRLVNRASTSATGIPSFALSGLSPLPANALLTSRAGSITVLAPTNTAMQAEGLNEAGIDALTPAQALTIARRHVVNLRWFSSDLMNQLYRNSPSVTSITLPSQQTGFNVVYNNNGGTVTFTTAGAIASIVNPDIVVTNGVVHVINTVLD